MARKPISNSTVKALADDDHKPNRTTEVRRYPRPTASPRIVTPVIPAIDPSLLDATVAVLAEHGWERLTLERVAEKAQLSRPTLWRRGISREQLITAVLSRLAETYRQAMVNALLTEGTGRERLERAMNALFDVADEHLLLLSVTDTAFHMAGPEHGVQPTPYISPLERLLRDGIADGSITWASDASLEDFAVVLFNVVWTYVHLRTRHSWSAQRTRKALLTPLLPEPPGGRG
jgi:AcrR family transcriptional regulator